jgi:hypothetical protein
MFLATMGLWADEFNADNTFDPKFWLRAEQSLVEENTLWTPAPGVNGPVLGVPLVLLKLLLLIRQIRRKREITANHTLRSLELEVSQWEACLSGEAPLSEISQSEIARDSSTMFIIIASILMEQISTGDSNDTTPPACDPDCWKLRYAMSILQKYQHDDTWSRFFTTTIAVYTLGFFVTRSEDVDLVRADLQGRWDATNFGHIVRYRKDLDAIWAKRGYRESNESHK